MTLREHIALWVQTWRKAWGAYIEQIELENRVHGVAITARGETMPSKIAWTDETWNPIIGCSHCSPGCDHCYAERMAIRQCHISDDSPYHGVVQMADLCTRDGWSGSTALVKSALDKPLHWRKSRRVFVCSMGDLFHESVPFEWVESVFEVMRECHLHAYQILTKRPYRVKDYWAWRKQEWLSPNQRSVWPENVWCGVTVCNQAEADEKIPQLLATPAALRFVSVEPMLGPIRLQDEWLKCCGMTVCDRIKGGGGPKSRGETSWCSPPCPHLGWVIVGGESGPGARPMNPEWVRDVRDQCIDAGVPFLFKQWGEWGPSNGHISEIAFRRGPAYDAVWRIGKKLAGRKLDGRTWDEFPG